MNSNSFTSEISGEGFSFGIVRSRFNGEVTQRMLDACIEVLKQAGVREEDIDVVEVPGAFEIPVVCQALAKKDNDAVITIGCIMRGQTTHDRYISSATISKLQDLAVDYSKPMILGIITPLDQEQADARSTGDHNKGVEAGMAALEMVNVMKNIPNRL